jgi:hypothetical protein
MGFVYMKNEELDKDQFVGIRELARKQMFGALGIPDLHISKSEHFVLPSPRLYGSLTGGFSTVDLLSIASPHSSEGRISVPILIRAILAKQRKIIATDMPCILQLNMERDYPLPDWLKPLKKDTVCPLLTKAN